MNTIPKLLDAIDAEAYIERLKTDTPTYETNIRGYEIVYRLLDDKPADLVRAIQEPEILKTRIKLRQGARVTTLPSFWEVWHNPDAGLAEDPNYALIPGYKDIMHKFGHEEKRKESLDTIFEFEDKFSQVATQTNANAHVALNPVATQTHVALNPPVATQTHVAFSNDFEIYAEPFEQGVLAFPPHSFDFAFTSPPYFDYEDYTSSNPKYKDWFREFYTPLFKQTCRVLKPGTFFAIHIGDTSAGQISRFLTETVPQITSFRYVSKIGLKGAHSNQIRDVWLFQKN